MYQLGRDSFNPLANTDHKKAYHRLFQIERFFSRIGRPLIDSAFYGVLVRDTAVEEGRAKEQRVQISKWAHALRTRLAPISIMLREKNYDLVTRYTALLSQAIHALTEFPELERIEKTLKGYYIAEHYTPNPDSSFVSADGSSTPSVMIDSLEAFIGVSIHALVSKVVIGTEKFGTFFDRFHISKEEFEPKLRRILNEPITSENWNEVTDLLRQCNIDIEIRANKGLIENYEPFVHLKDSNGKVKLHVGMFIMFILDELLSNAAKHAQPVGGHAWMQAYFILEGKHNDAYCRLEVSNSGRDVMGVNEGSREREVSSGMNFCQMIANALNAGEYNRAVQTENDSLEASYVFPVIFNE
jgi:hypothetical protein